MHRADCAFWIDGVLCQHAADEELSLAAFMDSQFGTHIPSHRAAG